MDTVIKQALKSDFDQVGQVFTQENKFHARLVPEIIQVAKPIMTRLWFDEKLSNPNKALFVAEFGKEIVGVLLIEMRTSPDDPIFRPRTYAYLDEIAVVEKYRGRGIGQSLMAKAHAWALAQGISEIELNVWQVNTKAIQFYERLGYTTMRRTMKAILNQGSAGATVNRTG